jgi:hypothetical protein
VTYAGKDLNIVPLELHTRAASVSEPTSHELVGDLLDSNLKTGWEPFDHDGKRRAMRLPCGQEAEHAYLTWRRERDAKGIR